MTRWIPALALLILVGMIAPARAGEDPASIRFAPLPMESRDHMTRQYLAFMEFLEQRLGHPFEMVYHQSYATLLDEFAAGRIDLAYLGPLPYVTLRARLDSATPVVRFLAADGSSSYTCSIIRFAAHRVDLSSRETMRVALTQPLSTCGYLGVETLLQRRGLSLESAPFDQRYVGTHEQVALAIVLGEADIGGIKTAIGERYRALGVVPVAQTRPMPGFVLVANADTLSSETIAHIKTTLLALDPQHRDADRLTTRAWGPGIRHGAIAVEDQDYADIRRLWLDVRHAIEREQ